MASIFLYNNSLDKHTFFVLKYTHFVSGKCQCKYAYHTQLVYFMSLGHLMDSHIVTLKLFPFTQHFSVVSCKNMALSR